MMKKLTKPIIYLVILLAMGVGAWYYLDARSTSASALPPMHTVVADRGDVSSRIVAFGSLQPIQMVTVGSQVSGIIEEIRVDFNDVVRRGQVLALIDPSTFEAAVSSARAELQSAEAGLELAQVQYNRVFELRERQFIAPSEVEQARATLLQAEAQLEVRKQALERAQRELDRCTIIAPTDGIVISRNVDVGQTVAASLSAPELFNLATDLRQMFIHANVSEADIGEVQDGQLVRFRVDAHRNRTFKGEVIQVRNNPLIMDNVVHYETIIAVDNSDLLLKPGMTAEVVDVLRVRNTALRARLPDGLRPDDADLPDGYNGRVYVKRGNSLISTPVRTGLSDGVNTEIISGITASDTLAVGLSLTQSGSGSNGGGLFGGNRATF
ncbi:MAG: efflux RND transporter periplasmic adaptor subunit [Bacteroidetes bacterium]|nr:efflux RND transporter periplasmic adaptor subunit [Bacteroidota bacterium]